MSDAVLEARGLGRTFRVGGFGSRPPLQAVREVDLAIGRGEIVALVGESGSGKSTLARLLAQILEPSAGVILFRGSPVRSLRGRAERLAARGAVQMVFQDPFGALNPAYRVSHGIRRTLALHRPELAASARQEEAERVVEAVGLHPAAAFVRRYPHELSGGERQRIGFAQALASRPSVILADEPVSMLDVSMRIGLLNLMSTLRDERGLSILYVTHDLASARYVADRLLVMHGGRIIESGPVEDVLQHPRHPRTRLLIEAVSDVRPAHRDPGPG